VCYQSICSGGGDLDGGDGLVEEEEDYDSNAIKEPNVVRESDELA